MSASNKVTGIENHILGLLKEAKQNGIKELVIRAGDIHADLKLEQRIVLVCLAMKRVFKKGDKIISLPRKRQEKGFRERVARSGPSFDLQCEVDGMFHGFNLSIKYTADR